MNSQDVLSEVAPLSDKDCFYVIERLKSEFTFPIHIHPEFELNFIENARGAQRIVGDSIEEVGNKDLVLITGKNLEHAWINHQCTSKKIREITVQFHPNFAESFLNKNQFRSIKDMFEKAQKGLLFSQKTIDVVQPLLMSLTLEKHGFYSVVKLLTILHELSLCAEARVLSSSSFASRTENFDSRRVQKVYDYINNNYREDIRLSEMAALVNMSEVSFSRFIKLRTGKSFTDFVIDIRLGYTIRMLVDSTHTIAEICYSCGFNNLSNFNRIFKKRKGITPKEFRDQYLKKKVII